MAQHTLPTVRALCYNPAVRETVTAIVAPGSESAKSAKQGKRPRLTFARFVPNGSSLCGANCAAVCAVTICRARTIIDLHNYELTEGAAQIHMFERDRRLDSGT